MTREPNDPKDKEILDFIKQFKKENMYSPSVREIGSAVNLKSSSSVNGRLKRLEEQGFIIRDPKKPRTIIVVGEDELENEIISNNAIQDSITPIPLLGTVAAGLPILAEQNIEDYIPVPSLQLRGFDKEDCFALKVKGESMINAGILPGDVLLVHRQPTIENGEIAVILDDTNSATVKRFYKKDGYYLLKPENDNMEPFTRTHVDILGKPIGLYRTL